MVSAYLVFSGYVILYRLLLAFINSAARLTCGQTPFDHVTDFLRDTLLWLRVPQLITCKPCLSTYHAWVESRGHVPCPLEYFDDLELLQLCLR